jgi:hypothetical protein
MKRFGRHPSRRGGIFLFALGVTSVLVALGFALMANARLAKDSGGNQSAGLLAEQAAQAGAAHALESILRDFRQASPNLTKPAPPTHLRGAWRSDFLPVDAYASKPMGEEHSPTDRDQDDSPVENLLTESYLGASSLHMNTVDRGAIYGDKGSLGHPGAGRWYEVGVRSSDPQGKPVQFDVPADASKADVLNQPLWYSAAWRPVGTRAEARYRLRYAVATEDLAGHLLIALPAPWPDSGAADGWTTTVTAAAAAASTEAAVGAGRRYGPALTSMFMVVGSTWPWAAQPLLGGAPIAAGLAANSTDTAPNFRDNRSISHIAGTACYYRTYTSSSPADHYLTGNASNTANYRIAADPIGPTQSWEVAARMGADSAVSYACTPFGRNTSAVTAPNTPQRWYEGRTDCPWRINAPTAAPRVISMMILGYMPQEYRVFSGRQIAQSYEAANEDFDGDGIKGEGWVTDNSESPSVRTVAGTPYRSIPLFDYKATYTANSGSSEFGNLFARDIFNYDFKAAVGFSGTPADPAYPGLVAKAADGVPLNQWWHAELGKDIGDNRTSGRGPAAYPPMHGQNRALLAIDGLVIGSSPRDRSVTPTVIESDAAKHRWYMGGSSFDVYNDMMFRYSDSYWLDIAYALSHAVAATQYAWYGRTWGGATAVWPTLSGFAADVSGKPVLSIDMDDDGVADAPAILATVADMDALFLCNLGEDASDRPGIAATKTMTGANTPGEVEISALDIAGSIKASKTAGTISAHQAALMELVVNDVRMSFFGASPQYPGFRPLDLDGDGQAKSSAYASGSAVAGTAPERYFSLTGYFVMQKSRYYRAFVRGEVYDELRRLPIAQANLETVFAIDTDGDAFDVFNRHVPASALIERKQVDRLGDSQVLYQRWTRNHYTGAMARLPR